MRVWEIHPRASSTSLPATATCWPGVCITGYRLAVRMVLVYGKVLEPLLKMLLSKHVLWPVVSISIIQLSPEVPAVAALQVLLQLPSGATVGTLRVSGSRNSLENLKFSHATLAQLSSSCPPQIASIRAEKSFSPCSSDNPEDQIKPMLDWANGGFLPKGEEGLKPTHTAGEAPFYVFIFALLRS